MVMLSMAGAPQLDGLYRSARAYDKKTFRYRVPEDGPLRRIQSLVARVARAVAPGPPPDLLVSAARSAGFELVLARDPAGELWVLHEPAGQHAGAGLYAFRAGVGPLCIQAPHTFFDEGTGEIALQLFAHIRAGALFVNTVHRYARSDGGSSASDVAHSERTMFAAATHGLYDAGRWDLIQVHGFGAREELPAHVKAVVSDGLSARAPGGAAERLRGALTRRWGEGTVRLFGVDTQVLGATTNVQGQAARAAKALFLHVELSATTRQTLGQDPAALVDSILETLGSDQLRSRAGPKR
jgi:hypothetical protein